MHMDRTAATRLIAGDTSLPELYLFTA